MKNRKTILLLLLGLVLALFVHVWLGRSEHLRAKIVRTAPLLSANARPTALELRRAGAPLVRLEYGDQWRLTMPFSTPADEQVVWRLIDALSQTELTDAQTTTEMLALGRTSADYRLEPSELSVLVEADSMRRIDFGAVTPCSNGVFATSVGSDVVGVLPMMAYRLIDLPVDALRRRALLSVDAGAVLAFTVKQGAERVLSFRRNGDQWKVGGETASGSKVRSFLSELCAMEAKSFVWPVGATNESATATASLLAVYGLDPESAVTVTLTCVDGMDRQVSFGMDTEEGLVYALAQNGSSIVTVDAGLRQQASQAFTDTRLFPCEVADVRSFSLADGAATYALARDEADGWRLDAPVVAPADGTTVRALLERLLALSMRDVSTTGVRVTLLTNAPPVTVVRTAALGDLRLDDLRSREILRIDPVVVRRLVRVSAAAAQKPDSVLYVRDRKCWTVEGDAPQMKTVRAEGVESVLVALNPLVATRLEKLKVAPSDLAAYGLEKPFLTLAVDREGTDAVRRNILIGKTVDSSGARYATVGSSDAVFVLSPRDVERLTAEIVSE